MDNSPLGKIGCGGLVAIGLLAMFGINHETKPDPVLTVRSSPAACARSQEDDALLVGAPVNRDGNAALGLLA